MPISYGCHEDKQQLFYSTMLFSSLLPLFSSYFDFFDILLRLWLKRTYIIIKLLQNGARAVITETVQHGFEFLRETQVLLTL